MSRWIALLAAVLAGCAMPEAQRAQLDPGNTAVPPGHGLVVARLVTNTTSAPLYLENATLTLRDVAGGKSLVLRNKAAPKATSTLFLEALPPGRYQPVALVATAGTTTVTAPLERQSPAFEVEADRISDLGAMVLFFDSVGEFSSKYRIAYLASPDDTAAALEALPAELARRLEAKPRLRAGTPLNTAVNNTILRDARALASITAVSPLVDGQRLVLGRTLGMVSLWDPQRQRWTHLQTGRSFGVRSVAVTRDGTLLVGMDEGVLLAHDGGKWQTLSSPVKNASTLFIGQSAGGEYFVITEDRAAFTVLSSDAPGGPWKEVRRFATGRFGSPSYNSRVQAALTNGRLALVLWPGGTEKQVLHTLDLRTRQWESTPLDFGGTYAFAYHFFLPAEEQVVASGGSAYTPALHWSRDGGKTFTSKALQNSFPPIFRDARALYVRRVQKMGLATPRDVPGTLWRSSDGGETWEQMGELPKFVAEVYALPRPGWLLAATTIGAAHISSDDGRTWTLTVLE